MTGTGQAQETFLPLLLSLISKLTVTLLNSFTRKFSNENERHRLFPKENAATDRSTHIFMYLQEVHSPGWGSRTGSNPVVLSYTSSCLTCMCSSILLGNWVMHAVSFPGNACSKSKTSRRTRVSSFPRNLPWYAWLLQWLFLGLYPSISHEWHLYMEVNGRKLSLKSNRLFLLLSEHNCEIQHPFPVMRTHSFPKSTSWFSGGPFVLAWVWFLTFKRCHWNAQWPPSWLLVL